MATGSGSYDDKEKRKRAAKQAALAKLKGKSFKSGSATAWSPTKEELKKLPAWMKKPTE